MSDSVALYLPSDPPAFSFLSSLPGVDEVVITEGNEESPQQYKITFLAMAITINVMPSAGMPEHLQAFSNYVMSLHIKTRNSATQSVLERIASTKTALGCVIEPGLDKDGCVGGFLTSITKNYSGLMFARDCIFDSDGAPLIQPSRSTR